MAVRDWVLVTANASSPERSPAFQLAMRLSAFFLNTGTLGEETESEAPLFLDEAGAPEREAEFYLRKGKVLIFLETHKKEQEKIKEKEKKIRNKKGAYRIRGRKRHRGCSFQ